MSDFLSLREILVDTSLKWEKAFGVAPHITSALSEYDAALLIGMTESEYSHVMQGCSAVQKGFDFRFKDIRYQVKATRPSGKPGSKVTKVPNPRNYDWDILIWMSYDSKYVLKEAWAWSIADYQKHFEESTRLSPVALRQGRQLFLNCTI